MNPRHLCILGLAVVGILLPAHGTAATSAAAPAPFYKIVSDRKMIVKPTALNTDITAAALEDLTPCATQNASDSKYDCTPAELQNPRIVYSIANADNVPVPGYKNQNGYSTGGYELEFPQGTFKKQRLYRLTYWQPDKSKKTPAGLPASAATSLTLETSPIATVTYVSRASAVAGPPWIETNHLFKLESNLALATQSDQTIVIANPTDCTNQRNNANWNPAPVTLSGKPSGKKAAGTRKIEVRVGNLAAVGAAYLDNPDGLGVIYMCVDSRFLTTDFTPDVTAAATALSAVWAIDDEVPPNKIGVGSVLGAKWALAPDTKFALAPPPTGKSDSSFYANVNMAAATGASFAWGLDGKIAELKRPIGLVSITWVSATANTGKNTSNIKGQTYTDSIGWTLPVSYLYLHVDKTVEDKIRNEKAAAEKAAKSEAEAKAQNDTAAEARAKAERETAEKAAKSIDGNTYTAEFTVGPDYETDINFDKKNLLFAEDSTLTFKKLYKPQSYRTDAKNGALVKYPDPSLAKFGYALQFHGGVETGAAIIDTVQKASSGTAKIAVPAYSIARAVPQLHGLLQLMPKPSLGLLTLDDTVVGRYLFEKENAVEQFPVPATPSAAATVGLRLRPVNGWRAINTLIGTWNPPNSPNVAITATYNDGFNAPKFTRTNSVTIGVTLMY